MLNFEASDVSTFYTFFALKHKLLCCIGLQIFNFNDACNRAS